MSLPLNYVGVFQYNKNTVLDVALLNPSLRLWCQMTSADVKKVFHSRLVNLEATSTIGFAGETKAEFNEALFQCSSLNHLTTYVSNVLVGMEHFLVYRSNLGNTLQELRIWGADMNVTKLCKVLKINQSLRKLYIDLDGPDTEMTICKDLCTGSKLEFLSITLSLEGNQNIQLLTHGFSSRRIAVSRLRLRVFGPSVPMNPILRTSFSKLLSTAVKRFKLENFSNQAHLLNYTDVPSEAHEYLRTCIANSSKA